MSYFAHGRFLGAFNILIDNISCDLIDFCKVNAYYRLVIGAVFAVVTMESAVGRHKYFLDACGAYVEFSTVRVVGYICIASDQIA